MIKGTKTLEYERNSPNELMKASKIVIRGEGMIALAIGYGSQWMVTMKLMYSVLLTWIDFVSIIILSKKKKKNKECLGIERGSHQVKQDKRSINNFQMRLLMKSYTSLTEK